MYNTPQIRNGGFGALQVEAVTNRPLSIARRHLAASQLRMRDIEPDELSSSEWVRFLVMEGQERERWMVEFTRRRRNSNESNTSTCSTETTASVEPERDVASEKAEEARQEAEEAARVQRRERAAAAAAAAAASSSVTPIAAHGRTPIVSLWARQFDEGNGAEAESPYTARRPRHERRAVTDGIIEAPPTYETALRSRTPPPAYEPRSDDEGPDSPDSPPQILDSMFRRF